jgi:signal transduction histidine kinase
LWQFIHLSDPVGGGGNGGQEPYSDRVIDLRGGNIEAKFDLRFMQQLLRKVGRQIQTLSGTVAPSREYQVWRLQFMRDRLQLTIVIAVIFLSILAAMNVGLMLPAVQQSGEQDLMIADYNASFLLTLLGLQCCGLATNLLILRRYPQFARTHFSWFFWGFSGAVLLLPQLLHMLTGKTMVDMAGWTMFFLFQAVFMPMQWQWHLVSQLSLVGLTSLSFWILEFGFVSISEGMQRPSYFLFLGVMACVCLVADLGIHLYERLLIREFDLRQRLQLFLHAVSHDLRNPMTGMLMLLQNLPEQQGQVTLDRSVIQQMQRSQERQLQLVNSLLEAHNQEAHGIKIHPQPLALQPFCKDLIDDLQPLLQERQGQVTLMIAPHVPLAMADEFQLQRVYENLISNALQYNAPGIAITLGAEVAGRYLRCTVSDDGQGLVTWSGDRPVAGSNPATADPNQWLFERYCRGFHRHQPLHLGLGLYICRQIIEAHGGQIGVASQASQGTTFWFTLPGLVE